MSKLSGILLIYQNSDMELNFYKIPSTERWLLGVHESFIGEDLDSDVEELVLLVFDLVCENPEYVSRENKGRGGEWVKYKIDKSSGNVAACFDGAFAIVHCGDVP